MVERISDTHFMTFDTLINSWALCHPKFLTSVQQEESKGRIILSIENGIDMVEIFAVPCLHMDAYAFIEYSWRICSTPRDGNKPGRSCHASDHCLCWQIQQRRWEPWSSGEVLSISFQGLDPHIFQHFPLFPTADEPHVLRLYEIAQCDKNTPRWRCIPVRRGCAQSCSGGCNSNPDFV